MERSIGEQRWVPAIVTLAAFVAGLTLPDIDQTLGIGHRSGVTHSVGVVVVALANRWRHAACGLGGGTGLHLAADCFPNAMIGYATVKLPFAGGIGAGWSYLWLAANAALGLAIAAVMLRRLHHSVMAAAVGVVGIGLGVAYLWRSDGGWPVLALFAGLGWLAWRWRQRRGRQRRGRQRRGRQRRRRSV